MSDVAALHQEVGELKGTVTALKQEVERLRHEVQGLVAVLNQGRGARYALILGYTILTLFGGILTYFGIKVSAGT